MILQEKRNSAHLSKNIRYGNLVVPIKTYIETLVSEGYLPQESTQEKYKCSRHRYNCMTGREQDAFDKKQCLIPSYNCFIPGNSNGFQLGKIEFDYMVSLTAEYNLLS